MKGAAGCIFGLPLLGIVFIALVLSVPARAENNHAEFDQATGYRISRYRAPVSEQAPGGKRVSIDEVERLIAENQAILIDAMASDGAGLDPATGEWRMATVRHHIPGSVWLPDVGKGALEPMMETYFKSELARLSGGDKTRAIVVYCLADCWMSWNAVKRAASYGYTSLYWFPEGTDGWLDFDRPLVPAEPVRLSPIGASRSGGKPRGPLR